MLSGTSDDVVKLTVHFPILLEFQCKAPTMVRVVMISDVIHTPLPPLLHLIYFFWPHLLGYHVEIVRETVASILSTLLDRELCLLLTHLEKFLFNGISYQWS